MPGPYNALNITEAGLQAFDGVSVFHGRTITAGTGISITNGSGVSGNPTISLAGGGVAVEHLTGDSGGQLNPDGSNNFNLIGQQAGTIAVMDTIGSASTISIENRVWLTQLVVDPSAVAGLRGTFTTITSALTAAVSGQTIFIRPGTYIENLTLKVGVNLTAFGSNSSLNATGNVIINGTCTLTTAGSVTISNIQLQTNSSALLSVTGTLASIVNLENCYINCTNNSGITYSSSNASSAINIQNCSGNLGTTGINFFTHTSAGNLNIFFSTFTNSGASTSASTLASGFLTVRSSSFLSAITNLISGPGTGKVEFDNVTIDTSAINTTSFICSGTGAGYVQGGYFASGTASTLDTTNAGINIQNATINSSNTNAITGGGNLTFAALGFVNVSVTNSAIQAGALLPTAAGSVGQVLTSNGGGTPPTYIWTSVTTPGAYPYTTLATDNIIVVDTSSARTIIPKSNPYLGQTLNIKDNIGSGATNNITVTPSGKNIDGSASYVMNTNYANLKIVFTGTEWSVL